MKEESNLKNKLKVSAAAGVLAAAAESCAQKGGVGGRPVRVGFVGLGGRGAGLLEACLGIEGVAVPAFCERDAAALDQAKRRIEGAGLPAPVAYGEGADDYRRMFATEKLDLVVCAAAPNLQIPICVAAMNNGANAVSGFPVASSVDECWELVETSEKTRKFCSILGGWGNLDVLNMIRQGVFGDMVHCEGTYACAQGPADLSLPIAPMIGFLDVNHGDRLDYLAAVSSQALAIKPAGPDDAYSQIKMAVGDYNCALIRTVGGKMITLNFNANSRQPDGLLRLQGTRAAYLNALGRELIYIDGRSPGEEESGHGWEEAEPYLREYRHPLRQGRAGGDGDDAKLMWERLITAVRQGGPLDRDVCDAATLAVLSPLCGQSAAGGSGPIQVPDFTRGKWETRQAIDLA